MKRLAWRLFIWFVVIGCLTKGSFAQQALTWREVRERFEASNPTLQAGRIGIEEPQAQQITAYLRPNPNFTASLDQLQPWKSYGTFADALPLVSVTYLIEQLSKRMTSPSFFCWTFVYLKTLTVIASGVTA
ncbi:MAG: hypothetical protein ABSG71_20015 [Thermodesulfobacteriota bacterium]